MVDASLRPYFKLALGSRGGMAIADLLEDLLDGHQSIGLTES